MKKNKGFTLIELLAVILILSIISLIAIPTVSGILKESRVGAIKSSMQNIIKAAEEKCLTAKMKGETISQFVFTEGKVSPSLDIKGELPTSGVISLNENCEANATMANNEFKYVMTNGEAEVEECTGNSCAFKTNITTSSPQYSCFTFDEKTGTILKYDGANPACQGDVYIPAMINNIPVTTINALAFVNPYEMSCERNGVTTKYDGTHIPAVDEICSGKYNTNYSYNSLNMEDAGFLVEIKDEAFYYTGIKEVKFNDNLRKIGDYAFDLINTRKIVLPKNLIELGEGAFKEAGLVELVINNKLKVIPEEAFSFNLIKDINIPEGVEYIQEGAFAWGDWESAHTTINISDTVIGIGGWAFMETGAVSVKLGKNLQYIGDSGFNFNYLTSINIPSSVTEIGAGAFTDNKLTENQFIYNRNADGTENKKSLNSYAGENTNIIVPDNIEELAKGSMQYCGATSITLPEGLKYIREDALDGNNLTTIIIPSTVEVIEKSGIEKRWNGNKSMTSIINKTGRSFDWSSITASPTANQVFETGTIIHNYGNITVSK